MDINHDVQNRNSIIIYDKHTKIPYYAPLNSKIDVPLEKFSLISIFTGGGGLDLGLEWAGFEIKCFVENNKYCIATINKNRKNWPLVGNGDITKITSQGILEVAGLEPGEPDLVVGGAPCQPFSSLGKNEGEKTSNGQLYKHFIRVVEEIQPSMFLFENVRGMMQNHRKIIKFMNEEFSRLGYGLSTALLCAADYGVPQKRYRVFIIGRRDGLQPGFPLPTHAANPEKSTSRFTNLLKEYGLTLPSGKLEKWVTVGKAFSELTPAHYAREDSFTANLSPKIVEMIRRITPATKMCWRDLPDELKFDCWKTGKFVGCDNFGRLLYEEPAVTIRTGAVYPAKGKYIHPEQNRGLNTIELATLQSFPIKSEEALGWYFYGGIIAVARQIGNAVPPLLAKALGNILLYQIEEVKNS